MTSLEPRPALNHPMVMALQSACGNHPRRDAIVGGLLGLLVGDALGVPYEFKAARDIPALHQIEMDPPAGFRRSHPGVPPGTWSDDGAQALCLLASLIACSELDLDDFAQRLVRWQFDGYMAVDGKVFDVGIQTSEAIHRLRQGVPPEQSGGAGIRDNGNGSLMRVLPLALWHQGSDESLVADARRSSLPTHAHLRSQLCCALYCLWARGMVKRHEDPWAWAVSRMLDIYPASTDERRELEFEILGYPPSRCHGGGYVVDCLHSARIAMQAKDFETAVRTAITFGNDTDTTACVTGGLAGIKFGINGIPPEWSSAINSVTIKFIF